MNPTSECDIYAEINANNETGYVGTFGGKIGTRHIWCGGFNEEEIATKSCYVLGEPTPFLNLLQRRAEGSSNVLTDNTLFIAGKLHTYVNFLLTYSNT